MNKIILTTLFLFVTTFYYGQKASDVLENSIKAKSDEIMIIRYNPKSKLIEYSLCRSLNDATKPVIYKLFNSDVLILNPHNSINVYEFPLNPLNYSFTNKIEFIDDQINIEGAKVVADLEKQFANVSFPSRFSSTKSNPTPEDPCITALSSSVKSINEIINELNSDQKDKIAAVFKSLKNLDFVEQDKTESNVALIEKDLLAIKSHFENTSKKISDVEKLIKDLNCDSEQSKLNKLIIRLTIKDLKSIYDEQYKRLGYLINAFDKVNSAVKDYSSGGGSDGLRWCKLIQNIETKDGKIAVLTLKLFESGLILTDKQEITTVSSKEIYSKEVKFRRFQRFVPEISAGTAYTFFNYKKYGTSTDASGDQIVSVASENNITNLNVTSMLNLTYYIENTNVNPFWQIGVGANSEIPTLLTGFGLRSVLGSSRICISGGIAMTWIKELQNLKIGDKVDGTTAIENDLKPTFSWPPKPYIGIQYNF